MQIRPSVFGGGLNLPFLVGSVCKNSWGDTGWFFPRVAATSPRGPRTILGMGGGGKKSDKKRRAHTHEIRCTAACTLRALLLEQAPPDVILQEDDNAAPF